MCTVGTSLIRRHLHFLHGTSIRRMHDSHTTSHGRQSRDPDGALAALLRRLDKETNVEVAIKVIDLEDVYDSALACTSSSPHPTCILLALAPELVETPSTAVERVLCMLQGG